MNETAEDVTMIEKPTVSPGTFTEKITVTPATNESKQIRNIKEKPGNKKSRTTKAEAKKQKLMLAPEGKNLKRKSEHPPTSEMVMDSIKSLKKRNGATFEDISKFMEKKYSVNMKVLKSHINKFLKKSVDHRVLEKTDGANGEEKFKIKKFENKKRNSKVLHAKNK